MHDHLTAAALTNVGTGISTTYLAMTDTVNLAIVAGAANVVIGVATLYFAYRAKAISQESKVISTEAKEISAATGQAVNGKMEEFKRMAESFFHAKGVADEKTAAEGKAGIEAIAQAKGKAEGKAEATMPAVLPAVVAALPPAAPAPATHGPMTTKLEHAIEELTDAAQDTVVAAENTATLAEKVPIKP